MLSSAVAPAVAPAPRPQIEPIPPQVTLGNAITQLGNAQGYVADMLNAKRYDVSTSFNARRAIENGVNLLNTIDPKAIPFTHVDSAASDALDAAASLKRATDYGFNLGGSTGNTGPVDPNVVQLALSRKAFDSLEGSLEALNNG